MAYTKQNFVDGQTLKAEHLNKIEDGIDELDTQISQLSSEKVDISDIVQESGQSETLVMSQKAVTNLVAGAQGGGSGLPSVDESDNGKTVKVVDGSWSVEQMSYNDLTNLPVYDTTPTSGSTNAVTSGGLYTKFTEQEEQINTALAGAYGVMSGALTWDGVIGNKEVIIVESNTEGTTSLVHVSDEYPEILSLFLSPSESNTLPCTIAMSGLFAAFEGGSLMLQYPIGMLPGGLVTCVGGVFIVPSDNYTPPEDSEMPFTFPKKGVYFICMTLNELASAGFSTPAMYVSALSLAPFHSFADNSGGDASKYFEEKDIKVDTLTWDGDITGREYVTQEVTQGMVAYICRLSDNVLTEKDVINGLTYTEVSFQTGLPETKTITAAEAQAYFMEDGRFACGAVLSVPVDNYTYNGIILPKAGIYFLGLESTDGRVIPLSTYITIPGYNFGTGTSAEVIKTEHLPQALRFGEIETTIESDTLTWDGNTEGLVNANGIFYKVSDTIPTLIDIHQGFSYTFNTIDGSESETFFVTAEEAASISMTDNGIIMFEIFCILTQPITEAVDDGTTIAYPAGVYLLYSEQENFYVSSFTINNYKGFLMTDTKLVKIDKKYLPDDIGGGSGSGLPEVSAEDNGKTVKVVNGEWSVEQMSYNDLSNKPTLGALASKNSLSASDVGADPSGTANSVVSSHNTNTSAHADIRTLIQGISDYFDSATNIIKTEHLPEALRFGGESTKTVYSNTLDYTGDWTDVEDFSDMHYGLYKISDSYFTLNDNFTSITLRGRFYILSDNAITGQYQPEVTYLKDELFGNETCCYMSGDVGHYFVSVSSDSDDFYGLPRGTYFFYDGYGDEFTNGITIEGISPFSKTTIAIDTIDPKYLPEDITSNIHITADSEMSDTSENPVQNKVIKAYIDNVVKEAIEAAIGTAIAASY